jgi:radical SAM family protein/uncharacterized protein DUF4070
VAGKSIYLINPVADIPGYFTAEVFAARGLSPAVAVADLAIATVAGLAPDDFHVELCDENASPINFDSTADYIGITGKVSQWGRLRDVADEFRRRGKIVIIGGPYASLSPEDVRPHCDILVRGEIEEIAGQIFSDLRSGDWQDEYVGTKPDLRMSPMPRWDLYPNGQALMGSVQTSRGCPFECEFCDVIQYLGRKQRHKPVDHVLAELDQLYRIGYRSVFLADDNFTVYRARAKELLVALRDWNARQTAGRMRLMSQVSVDAAGDEDMLQMCADAGLTHVFIGIETPNEESLREAKKRQNLKKNLVHELQTFIDFGMSIDCGMIVGFDNDDISIFLRQYEFAMATAVPIFSLGALVAPAQTPLRARFAKEGRLIEGEAATTGGPWQTNIIPKLMTREQLFEGAKWLCNSLYRPEAFEHRVMRMIETFGQRLQGRPADHEQQPSVLRGVHSDSAALVHRMSKLGTAESKMFSNIVKMFPQNPLAIPHVMGALFQYYQVRHMYEVGQIWDPMLPANAAARWRHERLAQVAVPA